MDMLSHTFMNRYLKTSLADEWGWRIPLMLGLPLILLSSRVRRQLPESEPFQTLKNKGDLSPSPLLEVLKHSSHRKKIFELIFAIAAPQGVTYYLAHNFSFQHVAQKFSLSSEQQNFLTIAVITLCWPITILMGYLSDRVPAKRLFKSLLIGCVIVIPTSFFILEYLIASSDFYWISFFPIVFVYSISIALYAPTAKILAESFPTRIRGLGVSIPYHIGNGIFGGAISIFGALQIQNTTGPWLTVSYTIFIVVLAIATLSICTQKQST